MASQWIRWRNDTHIYEYSIDFGANWGPLPLDASILTQGTINPARLPSGLVDPAGNNVLTGVNVLSNVYPRLTFNETDAAVSLRNWDIGADGSVFRLRALDDAFALLANLVGVTRAGQVAIVPTAPGVALDITSGLNPNLAVSIRNTDAGSNRTAGILLGNDTGVGYGQLVINSSGYTPSAWNLAGGFTILGAGAGGISLAASHANGELRFYSGGSANPRLTLQVSGNSVFLGTVTERNRSVAIGDWASYTPVWSSSGTQPTLGNGQLSGRYTRVGKTVYFEFLFVYGSTSNAGTGAYWWNLPLTAAGYATFVGKYLRSGATYQVCMGVFKDANSFQMLAHGVASQFGATVPFVWAVNDQFQVSGFYSEP